MLEVGALSLEALSRGAKKAYLCDNSKEAIKIIKMNIEKTRTTNSTSIYNLNYEKALLKFKEEKIKFNIVYVCLLHKLLVFNVKEKNWKCIQMDKEIFDKLSEEANKEVQSQK